MCERPKDERGSPAGTHEPPAPARPDESPARWSAQEKIDLVLRVLRGEPLDAVSRGSQVPVHKLERWTRVFLEQGRQGLRTWKGLDHSLVVWLAALALALLVLIGRYRWTPAEAPYSWRGYLLSGYLLVITLPILYYVLRIFIARVRTVQIITLAAAVVLTLPYHWLGLDRWYYHSVRPEFWQFKEPGVPPPALIWFPRAFAHLPSVPYEVLFFIVAALFGLGLAALHRSLRRGSNRHLGPGSRSTLWVSLYLLILLQTWLHLSMRNPAVYVPHFTVPDQSFYYHVYLFPNGQGAVNQEYGSWRNLDKNFMGISGNLGTWVMRRSFPAYVTSQFSYFLAPYYVYLVRNIIFWFSACAAAYFLVLAWTRDQSVATYTAFLVSCGTGFITFASEPAGYLPATALPVLLLYFFERILVRDVSSSTQQPPASVWDYLLFGAILGLGGLVYDVWPLYLLLLLYGFLRPVSQLRLVLSFAVSLAIYTGFDVIQLFLPRSTLTSLDDGNVTNSIASIRALVTTGTMGNMYGVLSGACRAFFGNLFTVFFILPVLFAIAGLFVIRSRLTKSVIIVVMVPLFLTKVFMHAGGTNMANHARYMYAAYPAIYLLSAIFLADTRAWFGERGLEVWGRIAVVLSLGAVFVLNNADVLGYPQLYFFFWLTNYEFHAK